MGRSVEAAVPGLSLAVSQMCNPLPLRALPFFLRRPPIGPHIPPSISKVIQACWAQDPAARPTMAEVGARAGFWVMWVGGGAELEALRLTCAHTCAHTYPPTPATRIPMHTSPCSLQVCDMLEGAEQSGEVAELDAASRGALGADCSGCSGGCTVS